MVCWPLPRERTRSVRHGLGSAARIPPRNDVSLWAQVLTVTDRAAHADKSTGVPAVQTVSGTQAKARLGPAMWIVTLEAAVLTVSGAFLKYQCRSVGNTNPTSSARGTVPLEPFRPPNVTSPTLRPRTGVLPEGEASYASAQVSVMCRVPKPAVVADAGPTCGVAPCSSDPEDPAPAEHPTLSSDTKRTTMQPMPWRFFGVPS
jgi:hypothetical protein